MISVYIDTNCINAKQQITFLNELETLHSQDRILIEKTDALDTELQEGKNQKRLSKSGNLIESYGVAVLDHSRLGHSIVGSDKDAERFDKVLEVLWGRKPRSHLSKQQIRDGMHIDTTIRYGGTFFVTNDKEILAKAEILEEHFGIKIRNPKNCLLEVKQRLIILEANK